MASAARYVSTFADVCYIKWLQWRRDGLMSVILD
jgi:hypothetical protein